MEAEEEVRSVEGWAPGADEPGLILQLLFLSLAPKSALVSLCPSPSTAVPVFALLWVATLDICSPSLSPPFLFSHLPASGSFHFTLEVALWGAEEFLRPGPALELLPA